MRGCFDWLLLKTTKRHSVIRFHPGWNFVSLCFNHSLVNIRHCWVIRSKRIRASTSRMESCTFLEKLPAEVRLRIYEHLLTFDRPIKLRQVVPGSRDLSILRVCKQIYEEVSINLLHPRSVGCDVQRIPFTGISFSYHSNTVTAVVNARLSRYFVAR